MKKENSNKLNKKGFTLLELLIVVIIIGILAAIVLPQYKLAVEKSIISKYLSIGQSIRNAEEVFYMANGRYSRALTALDIDIRSLCEDTVGRENLFYNCIDKSIVIDSYGSAGAGSFGVLAVEYCSALANTTTSDSMECYNNRDLILFFYFANYSDSSLRNKIVCRSRTDKGKKLCKALGY